MLRPHGARAHNGLAGRVALVVTLASSLLTLGVPGPAWARQPQAPPPAATAAPTPQAQPPQAPQAPQPQSTAAAPQGAIVIATSDAASAAAHALALDVYRAPELRPSIDDATARTLAGEPPPENAAPRLKEIAELRASIAKTSSTAPGSDLVVRRLLASLGAELGAAVVVAVAMDGSRPVARVLRTSTAAFERVELGPTVDIAPDGARTFRWPGASATIATILLPPPPAPAVPGAPLSANDPSSPLAPKADVSNAPATPTDRPFYKSPWFWGSVGGAVAVGLSVFAISRATSSANTVHLTGKVGP